MNYSSCFRKFGARKAHCRRPVCVRLCGVLKRCGERASYWTRVEKKRPRVSHVLHRGVTVLHLYLQRLNVREFPNEREGGPKPSARYGFSCWPLAPASLPGCERNSVVGARCCTWCYVRRLSFSFLRDLISLRSPLLLLLLSLPRPRILDGPLQNGTQGGCCSGSIFCLSVC